MRNPTYIKNLLLHLVRDDNPDLTARQLCIFLICYLDEKQDYTVRELAQQLNVSKPAVTRAIDRLEHLNLLHRRNDPRDGRSVLTTKTNHGHLFLAKINNFIL